MNYTVITDELCPVHGGHNFVYQYNDENIIRTEWCGVCSEARRTTSKHAVRQQGPRPVRPVRTCERTDGKSERIIRESGAPAESEESVSNTIDTIDSIDLFRSSAGDPHGCHVVIDPYWNVPGGWDVHEHNDGAFYWGVLETLHRLPGESDADFEARANARADELEETI